MMGHRVALDEERLMTDRA